MSRLAPPHPSRGWPTLPSASACAATSSMIGNINSALSSTGQTGGAIRGCWSGGDRVQEEDRFPSLPPSTVRRDLVARSSSTFSKKETIHGLGNMLTVDRTERRKTFILSSKIGQGRRLNSGPCSDRTRLTTNGLAEITSDQPEGFRAQQILTAQRGLVAALAEVEEALRCNHRQATNQLRVWAAIVLRCPGGLGSWGETLPRELFCFPFRVFLEADRDSPTARPG